MSAPCRYFGSLSFPGLGLDTLDGEKELMEQPPLPVAQYLRMSTDTQQLSLKSQADVIQQYAEAHGFKIVQSYKDPGRSGLRLKCREGLARLLHDVVSGDQLYRAVLVYDVSRWGRFQDTDEAAHYEFVCRNAGIPIHYCAESFVNDGSAPNAIMKTLKRVMAGEYSRDLSLRVSRTKRMIAERGFFVGGNAGYGLRRMLIASDGTPKRILEPGDRNSLVGGRVVLVLGPPTEVSHVREIFRLAISGRSCKSIAQEFNSKQIMRHGHLWHYSVIQTMLHNPKYMGCASWGHTTGLLGAKRVRVPYSQWVTKAEAFRAIIDKTTFDTAQRVIQDRTCNKPDEELLDALRSLLSREGKLTHENIDRSCEVPSARTYRHRFGSLQKACQLIGYRQRANGDRRLSKERVRTRRQTDVLRRSVIREIRQKFRGEVRVVRSATGWGRPVLCFDNGLRIPIFVSRCFKTARGNNRWKLALIAPEQGLVTLICRCTPSNEAIQDFHLVPTVKTRRGLRLTPNDSWLKEGEKLPDLRSLLRLAQSAKLRPRPTE